MPKLLRKNIKLNSSKLNLKRHKQESHKGDIEFGGSKKRKARFKGLI